MTHWTQTNAGGYAGFELRADPADPAATGATFGNVFFGFFSETNDVPTHIAMLNFPTNNLFVDHPFVVDLEIYDPDSRITSVRLFEEVRSATSTNLVRTNLTEAVLDLPPGTNFVSLASTNVSAGTHRLGIEVGTESGTTSYFFPYLTFFPAQAGAPVHRWFGTEGDSKSFYVVDAVGRAWVWGDNTNGQLGLGLRGDPITRPMMLPPPAGKKWRQFTSASYCAVGVTDGGAIYWMGQNINATSIFPSPYPNVPVEVSMGGNRFARSVGLTESSLLIINEWSQLITLYAVGPGVFSQNSYVDLRTGGPHLLALETSGRLLYGPEAYEYYATFDASIGALPWKDFSTCATHSLAVDAKRRLYAWGLNDSGQLPFSSGTNFVASPQLAAFPTGVTAWTKVAAGKYVSLAVDQDGRLFSWGKNGYTGSAESYVQSKIVRVLVPPEETGWIDVAAGATFAMALSTRGNVYVWGDIPASPSPRHVSLPEIVTGLPDLLNVSDTATVMFEPNSLHADSEFAVDLIAPSGATIAVQTSSDLVNWTTVTNISNALSNTHFTAPISKTDNFFIRVR